MKIATEISETIVKKTTRENDYSQIQSPEESDLEEGELTECKHVVHNLRCSYICIFQNEMGNLLEYMLLMEM